jgi:hypothetical protein
MSRDIADSRTPDRVRLSWFRVTVASRDGVAVAVGVDGGCADVLAGGGVDDADVEIVDDRCRGGVGRSRGGA